MIKVRDVEQLRWENSKEVNYVDDGLVRADIKDIDKLNVNNKIVFFVELWLVWDSEVELQQIKVCYLLYDDKRYARLLREYNPFSVNDGNLHFVPCDEELPKSVLNFIFKNLEAAIVRVFE